jgi:Fe-S-cluster containining protein
MGKEKFYKDGLNFSCQRCSFCCGHSPGFVYLSERDLTTLCNHFNMSIKAFVEKYCRWADYYYGDTVLALLEKENYDCILWENGCSAYEARPVQCSTYPFWAWMLVDKKTWDECAADCPGMNKGKKWTFEEIEKNRSAYVQNIPLKQEQVMELIKKQESQAQEKNASASEKPADKSPR